MNFELDEMQTMLKDSVARYLEKNYDFETRRRLVHDQGGFSDAHWSTFVAMGWLGASLSEEQGGHGGGAVEAAIIMEEFGRVMVIEPFLAVGVLAAQTLAGIGGDVAIGLIRAIVAGDSRVVLAHGEAAARGGIAHVATTAARDGEGWRIHGAKALVLGAPFADRFLVSARTSGAVGDAHGISLFLVPADAEGLTILPFRLADGTRAAELVLENVWAGADAILGEIDGAWQALDRAHAHAIVAVCAEAVGAMDHALWLTRDYIRTRKQFGVPIGSFQALQHRMADMLIELELCRSTLYRALANIDADPGTRAHAASVAKVQMGKSAKFVGGQAIQLHGGIGVTEEYAIGHYFKRLTLLDNLFGPVQAHLSVIAETA